MASPHNNEEVDIYLLNKRCICASTMSFNKFYLKLVGFLSLVILVVVWPRYSSIYVVCALLTVQTD